MIRYGLFQTLVSVVWMCLAGTAVAGAYMPWEKGDVAVFADSWYNAIRVEVDDKTGDWTHYTEFAGLGPLWVLADPDDERVYIRPTKKARKQLFVDFAKPEGTVTNIQVDPCNRGSVQIVSKSDTASVPAGEFKNVIHLSMETSCADSGVTGAWFAPGVGFIKWESSNIAGSVTAEMVQGVIGKNTYPQGLCVSAFFPDPSITINMEPPVDPDRAPDTVSVYLVITNNTGRDLTYTFPTGQMFEISLLNSEGKAVSLWSRGKAFTGAVQTLTLGQGKIWKFGGKIELADDNGDVLPAGGYTLSIEMTSSPDAETDHPSGAERLGATAPINVVHAL